ncbi:MAG: hypothetical protein ACREGL_09885 [Alphaproteobacteria bacterium]
MSGESIEAIERLIVELAREAGVALSQSELAGLAGTLAETVRAVRAAESELDATAEPPAMVPELVDDGRAATPRTRRDR